MPSVKQSEGVNVKTMLDEAMQRHRGGELAVAEVLYREVLKSDPKNFDALHLLAVIGHQAGQTSDSLELFAQAHQQRPNEAPMLVNYGAALRKAGRYDDAIAMYDKVLFAEPQHPEALYNKAQSLADLFRYEESADYCRRCLALNPRDAEVLSALGNALKNTGRPDDAIVHYDAAIAINPRYVIAIIAKAEVFRNWGKTAASLELYEQALRIDPRNPLARVHRSVALLKLGRLDEGWKDYDGRFWYMMDERETSRRPVPPMYWDGENLDGKSIQVWTEQGIGDEIIYANALPDLIARAGCVVLECAPRMVPVFRRSFPDLEVVGWAEQSKSRLPASKVNYQVAIGSVGRYLRPNFESFPRHDGYLKADPVKTEMFKSRYGPGPLVGISWRSARKQLQAHKSAALSAWSELLRIPGLRFVNLQYGDCAAEIAEVEQNIGVSIINDALVDPLKDMDGFFSQVAAMDLVLSVSNSTIHVAGSLGVPAWLFLPSSGKGLLWYWFLEREDSPWYPSVRLLRQTEDLKIRPNWWIEVLARARAELGEWALRQGRT
jgi:tetratricopeptide (TPR) repeat protein